VHDGSVSGAQMSGDGSRLFSWSADNTIRVWDVATGRQIGPAMRHDEIRGAQLSRAGSRIRWRSWNGWN
jgi:WD40 repeat protein